MPRKIKMEVDSDEDDDGPMPDWKRKKNLEKLQKLKVCNQFLRKSKLIRDLLRSIIVRIFYQNI